MKELPLMITVANAENSQMADEVYANIERQLEDFPNAECYRLEGGPNTRAAIDFVAVLSIASGIASIASLVWTAYDFMRKRHKRTADSFLYVVLDPSKGIEWRLGKDILDREVFIKDFEAKVRAYVGNGEGQASQTFISEVRASELWIRKP